MQKIGATGDGKSAVATPDGKKPKEEDHFCKSSKSVEISTGVEGVGVGGWWSPTHIIN